MISRLTLIIIFCIACLVGQAQVPIKLTVHAADSGAASLKVKTEFANRAQLQKFLVDLPSDLLGKGYLSASLDSISVDSPRAEITLFLGKRYKWGSINLPAGYEPLAQELGLGSKRKKEQAFIDEHGDYHKKVLDYFEDNGYPFALVGYDSVWFDGEKLSGKMAIDKGIYYKIDSIAQQGQLRLKPAFIQRYLGLPIGAPYQISKLNKIGQRLDELPFAQQQQPWDLNMLGTGGVVNVYLEPRKSNVLNILLGVMPSSTQTPENKLLVTGDANIILRNSFRAGETIGVNWQQIQYKSPRLNLLYQQPYLFGSRAGIDFYFELFKKDTQFVNLQVRLGMPYEFTLNKAGKVFFHYQQTNVTYVDTNFVIQTGQLPDLAATAASSLGLDFTVNNTNYRLNPRSGNEGYFYLLGGTKSIKPSQAIVNLKDPNNPGADFSGLYDSLATKTYQYRIKVAAAKYFSIGKASVIKLAANAATYESGNYFRNELFQIGGFRLLRGFDEESIFARRYAIFTSEFRLLSGKNSYFFGFFDGGYAQYKDKDLQYGNGYFGSGLGMVLETKNSLINISWAIGKRDDLPLDFRQSKIHLGLINFF